jgi:cobalt-zinc-cadmium efflux system outer membrane protein
LFFGLSFASSVHAAPSLSVFIQQVLVNSPAIQAAESNVAAANARERAMGRPLYNPELSAQAQSALENQTSIGLNQTVDWANKRGVRHQVGAFNTNAQAAALEDLKQQLAIQVLSALAAYQTQQRATVLAKERTTLLQRFVELTQKRYTSGDVARVDLDLAQLALAEALAQQADIEVRANRALQVLRATTGFTDMAWPRLPASLPALSSDKMDIDNLVNKLPSVLALNQQYQAAQARVKLAEQERYPDPTIGVQGGESSGGGKRKTLVGVTVSIPLYVRNTYKAEVDAANDDAMEADAKRADIMRQARAGIQSSAEQYQILYLANQQWQQAAGKPLGDGMVLIERLWQAGEINSTDYIVQLKQRVDSQTAGIELKGRAWEAWTEWLRASGQTNDWLQLKSPLSGK